MSGLMADSQLDQFIMQSVSGIKQADIAALAPEFRAKLKKDVSDVHDADPNSADSIKQIEGVIKRAFSSLEPEQKPDPSAHPETTSPLDGKSSLIQHTSTPTNDTARETPEQQVSDTVQADLFSWDPLEGVDSALTRGNIRAFNDIRMKGELFAPGLPANYINTLGAINPIQVQEGMPAVKKTVATMLDRGIAAASLYVTPSFKSSSAVLPNPCPFGFQGRRETPFIPINTLGSGFSADVSLNGLPAEYYDHVDMADDDSEHRSPLTSSDVRPISQFTHTQQIQKIDAVGLSWIY
jgi:hypothetical protein